MGSAIRVLVVEDEGIVRGALEQYLRTDENIEVVGSAADGVAAVRKAHTSRPNVVLMDIRLPKKNGIEATREITSRYPQVNVLLLTAASAPHMVKDALAAGARGYIPKRASPRDLLDAIHDVSAGYYYIHSTLAEASMIQQPQLTDREKDVLHLLAQGLSNDAIADRLYLSPRTVGNHVSSILSKLSLENRTQAVIYAFKRGIASPDMLSE